MRRDKTPLSAYETLCSLPSPPEILITEATWRGHHNPNRCIFAFFLLWLLARGQPMKGRWKVNCCPFPLSACRSSGRGPRCTSASRPAGPSRASSARSAQMAKRTTSRTSCCAPVRTPLRWPKPHRWPRPGSAGWNGPSTWCSPVQASIAARQVLLLLPLQSSAFSSSPPRCRDANFA